MAYSPRSPYTARGADPGRYTSTITDLIQQGGDIQARNAAAQGQIWGGAIQDVGQIAGNAFGDVVAQKAEEKALRQKEEESAERDAKIYSMVSTWNGDPMALAAVSIKEFGPEFGLKLTEGILGAQKMGFDVQEAQRALEAGDEKAAQSSLEQARQSLKPQFDLITAMGGPTNPVAAQYLADALPTINAIFPAEQDLTMEQLTQPEVWESVGGFLGTEKPEPIKLGKSDRLVSPTGEEIVGAAPESAKAGTLEAYIAGRYPAGATPEQQLAARREFEAAGRAPESAPIPGLNDVDKLAQRWTAATDQTREINRQVKIMEEGLASARKGDLAAGSQAVLVTFQKILDPTSVVRESEYARSADGQSAIARAEGIIDKLSKGGAGVPVRELEKFADLAERMAKAGASGYLEAERERLGRLADRYKIERDLVFPDYDLTERDEDTGNPFRYEETTENPFR